MRFDGSLLRELEKKKKPPPKKVNQEAAWWVSHALADYGTRVHAVTGGLGSGKTHGAVQWHYARCTQNQASQFSWFVEPVFARIRDTALPKWRKFFESINWREGIHFHVSIGNPTIIRLPNGHEIHLLSGHNPDLMVGAEISHFTIDEPGSQKYDVFLNCMSRMRDPSAWFCQALLSGTPQGGNWYMDLFDFKGIDVERRYRRFQLWTDDNAHRLAPDYLIQIEQTYKAFPLKVKSYRYGEFTAFYEGQCITEFSEATDVDATLEPDPESELYLTLDFNAYPLAWVALQVQPFLYRYGYETFKVRKFVALGESAGDSMGNLEDTCAEFVRKFPKDIYRNTPIRIYGDRTGHAVSHKIRFTDYQQVENYLSPYYSDIEVCAERKVAPQVASIEEVNRLFSWSLFLVHPRCRNFINSLKNTKWRPGKREIDKPAGETHTHWLDAVKYCVYQLGTQDILNAKRQIIYGVNR